MQNDINEAIRLSIIDSMLSEMNNIGRQITIACMTKRTNDVALPSIIYNSPIEALDQQKQGAIFFNIPAETTLEDVSASIVEGPIHSIPFDNHPEDGQRFVSVVFLYARNSERYFQEIQNLRIGGSVLILEASSIIPIYVSLADNNSLAKISWV